jgi:hypothetical protein
LLKLGYHSRKKNGMPSNDRDINAARNTLFAGAGYAHEVLCANA